MALSESSEQHTVCLFNGGHWQLWWFVDCQYLLLTG